MRVLHILETLAAGGVETTFLNVLRHLPRDGVTHDVLAFAGGALEAEYRHVARQVFVEARPSAIGEIVTANPYDVAYVLFERCAERVLPILFSSTNTRVVYGKNYDFSGQWRSTEGFRSNADVSMLEACDALTFTTVPLAESFGAPAVRGLVLGKGADVAPFMEVPPPDAAVGNRILSVANPAPRKRLGDLIDALRQVRRLVPDADLRIVGHGDPHEVSRLKAAADAAGLAASVSFAGCSRDVVGEMRRARVFALPSGSEGVPTAVLEAMAAARPIVTSNAGHVESIVDDGVEGYVVGVGDVAALADRLLRLLRDPSLAAAMGSRGRVRAARHSVEAVAARLAAHLQGIAA